MNKDMKNYRAAIVAELDDLTAAQAEQRLRWHIERVRDFQHERLVHLIVTLFFGALVVVGAIGVYAATQASLSGQVIRMLQIVVGILLVTELFYIGYYYRLENGVQRLYTVTAALQRKASDTKQV